MKRYQVYLNPQSVAVLDEISGLADFTRSELIREAVDAAAGRIGNLLALINIPPQNYTELDKIVGAIDVKEEKGKKLSENVDEIYYK
jgi:hypothetical protein